MTAIDSLAEDDGSTPSEAETTNETVNDSGLRAQRMAQLDTEDHVIKMVEEIVTGSLLRAEASYIERRLMVYVARTAVDSLFMVVAACEPTLADHGTVVFDCISLPQQRVDEEPPQSTIDATCRHEICIKEPSSCPPTPLTSRKSKRVMLTTSLAASSMLSNSTTSLSSSPRAAPKSKPPATSPTGPVPGVPFSTVTSSTSPRKSVALLKTAMRLAQSTPLNRQLTTSNLPMDESCTEDVDRSTDDDSDTSYPLVRGPQQRSLKGAFVSPTATTLSSNAWSITLPGKSSVHEDNAAITTSVDVEYVLSQKLPVMTRRPSSEVRRTSRDLQAPAIVQHQSTFLQLAHEQDAVEVDLMGMLGFDMRERLALSPGVKLQSDEGEFVKSGPQLPDVPTKMRRATFIHEASAIAVVAAPSLSQLISPTRPPRRPSTTNSPTQRNDESSGVFSLTECMAKKSLDHHHESTRSLAMSHAASIASSSTTTTSVKSNLFRKPSKVARPCTAASECCRDHVGECVKPPSPEVFADLVKQRAFQRKPSMLLVSPPKKSPTRRSLRPSTTSSGSSPLARRSLSSKHHDDPLRYATSLL